MTPSLSTTALPHAGCDPAAVQIRVATADDHPALCRLYDELDRFHRVARPELFRSADGPARTPAFVSELIEGPGSALLVAEHGDTLSGLVTVLLRDVTGLPILVPHRVAVIDNLVVRAARRRLGIGRDLVVHAERWADAHAATAVEIVVHDFNIDARRFYAALGYRPSTVRLRRALDLSRENHHA